MGHDPANGAIKPAQFFSTVELVNALEQKNLQEQTRPDRGAAHPDLVIPDELGYHSSASQAGPCSSIC